MEQLLKINKGFDYVYDGYYWNGKWRKGNEGDKMTLTIPAKWKEIGVIGDLYPSMGEAMITLDGKAVVKIDSSLITMGDTNRMKRASRAYRQLLFASKLQNKEAKHKLEIEVTKGNIYLAGFLVDEKTAKPGVPDEDYGLIEDAESEEQIKKPNGAKSGAIVGIVIGMIACVALAMFVGVIGVRNGWWYRSPEDSDTSVRDNFTI